MVFYFYDSSCSDRKNFTKSKKLLLHYKCVFFFFANQYTSVGVSGVLGLGQEGSETIHNLGPQSSASRETQTLVNTGREGVQDSKFSLIFVPSHPTHSRTSRWNSATRSYNWSGRQPARRRQVRQKQSERVQRGDSVKRVLSK